MMPKTLPITESIILSGADMPFTKKVAFTRPAIAKVREDDNL
jgi:hypothetical protein